MRSHPFQYLCRHRLCRSKGICCDVAFRMMVRKIFSIFFSVLEAVFAQFLVYLFRYWSKFAFFKLKLVLMRIGRWSESRFVYVCQLVYVMRG